MAKAKKGEAFTGGTATAPAPKAEAGPALALAAVPGMPPEAAAIFAARGVRTLGDLRPLVEAEAAGDAQCEPVFVLTSKWELPLFARYKTGEALIALLGGRAHMLALMAAWPKPAPVAPVPAADFDEATPAPRGRPEGEPLRRRIEMPAGESLTGAFGAWDVQGRIPVGCVLADFVGTGGRSGASGYRVAALSHVGTKGCTALGTVGAAIDPELLDGYRILTEVVQRGRTAVVFVPRTGGR